MPLSRDQKVWAATRRAQFALETAINRIDYMEEVKREIEELGKGNKDLESTGDPRTDSQRALPMPPMEDDS